MDAKANTSRTARAIALAAIALMGSGGVACLRTLDVSKIKCVDQASCPSGYYCSRGQASYGTCKPDQTPVDGSSIDQATPTGIDGAAGLDTGKASGGTAGTALDGSSGAGGADGGRGTSDGAAGGTAGGGTAGGGITGGMGGVAGGAGGTASPDAPTATGGSTTVPDASIALDGPDAPVGSATGTVCTSDGQCASGHCLDGVCCATACSGCNACASALTGKSDGTCAPVASGKNPHSSCTDETATLPCGNDGTCDGKGACRKVGAGQKCGQASCSTDGITFTPAPTCDGSGTCSAGASQSCTPYQCALTGCAKTCTQQTDCGAGNYCDTTAGTCATQKPNGTSATQTYECTSKIVADGVCCDQACTGCSACTAALNGQAASTTGRCLPVVAAKAPPTTHAGCTAAPPCGLDGTCDGNGSCRLPVLGTACGTPSCACDNPSACSVATYTTSACDVTHTCAPTSKACAGSLVCASATACKTGNCTADSDCLTGNYCASGTCTPKITTGTCTAANQCSLGFCVDGYCCDQKCDGTCQSCKQTPGTCKSVTTPRTSCGGSGTCGTLKCDGTHTACVYPGSETACPSTCSTDSTAMLSSTCDGSGACGPTQSSPCGTGLYCSGGQCTGQLANGTGGCSSAAACSSGNCSTSPTNGTMCCASNWQNCSQGCYNLTSDPTHCGSCNGACAPNMICSSKTCYCAGGQFACGTCDSWNFESNTTEGWTTIPGFNPVTSITASTFRAVDGTHSLKYHLVNGGTIAVPLCSGGVSPTNVSSMDFWIYLDGPSTFQGTTGGDLALLYDCTLTQQLDGSGVSGPANQWFEVTRSVSAANACYLVITLTSSTAWTGDVYIDKVQLTP